jgi:hypothetical protein
MTETTEIMVLQSHCVAAITCCGAEVHHSCWQDDLFGETFPVCDSDFDQEKHVLNIKIPNEVDLTMRCPDCNPKKAAPSLPPDEPASAGDSKHTSKRAALPAWHLLLQAFRCNG